MTFERLNLKKLRKKGYKISVLASIINDAVIPSCLLCEERNIKITSFFVDDKTKQVTEYFLCESCGSEILTLPEAERASILEKVIERKIAAFHKGTHLKMSEVNADALSAMKHKPLRKKDLEKMSKKNVRNNVRNGNNKG
jgi:hypothetical protein